MKPKITETEKQDSLPPPTIDEVQILSPHERALYETGISILQDSVETSRGFCKISLGTSTGAIPLYLAILALIMPDNYKLNLYDALLLLLPTFGFIVAATLSIIEYLPMSANVSLDILDEIRQERKRMIKNV